MTPTNFIQIYQDNEYTLSRMLLDKVKNPIFRDSLYSFVLKRIDSEYRALLLTMFGLEKNYRDAIWHGTEKDENDLYENIYKCAFLLYKIGNVEDVFTLWEAKYLNMDIGSMIDANYMIGAGYKETIDYLSSLNDDNSMSIKDYIEDYWEDVESEIEEWEKSMVNNYF